MKSVGQTGVVGEIDPPHPALAEHLVQSVTAIEHVTGGRLLTRPPHVVSPELEQVVRRTLQFEPQGRWPTVDALKAELVRLSAAVRIRAGVMTDRGMGSTAVGVLIAPPQGLWHGSATAEFTCPMRRACAS